MRCVVHTEKRIWSDWNFWGPMGKSELVWVVTPFLTSPKQHAASLESSRNKPSTVNVSIFYSSFRNETGSIYRDAVSHVGRFNKTNFPLKEVFWLHLYHQNSW